MVGNYSNMTGGAALPTANPSYNSLSIATSATLVWPTESTEGASYVATELDVTATASSLSLAMPSALLGATGPASIITNVGSNSFTVTDSAGAAIIAIAAGLSYLVSLTSNATAAGTWRVIQMGTASSAATASALADNRTIQASGSTLQVIEGTLNIGGVTTSLGAANRGQLGVCTSGSGGAVLNLDTTTNLGAGWYFDIANEDTTAVTLNGSGGESINGAATITFNGGTGGRVVAKAGAFNLSVCDLLTSNAVVLGGGASGTLKTVASRGTSGQVLTSNGSNIAPSFQTISAPTVPVTGNGLYNGGARVGARGDASITVNLSTTPSYGQVDQVRMWISGTGATVGAGTLTRQSGNTFGSTGYSAQITGFTATGTVAAATVNFGYRMESRDALAWVNQTGIVQLVVNQNTGSSQNYTITVNKATVADNFTAVTQIGVSSSIAVASGTPTTISFSAALGACGNGIEVIVSSICGAVTTKNFDFTDFGLFMGTAVLSPFPETPYNTDLINCKRSLPRWFWTAININTHAAYATSTTNAQVPLPYDVEPRVATTAILVGSAAAYSDFDVATGNRFDCTSAPTFIGSSKNALTVQAASTTNLTTHSPIFFGSGSAGSAAYIIATGAEL